MELEQTILGSALAAPEHAYTIVSRLRPDDFYNPRDREIFDHIYGAVKHDEPTDPVALATRMGERLERLGGHMYLVDLLQSAQPASLGFQIDRLRQKAQQRRLQSAGARIESLAQLDDVGEALTEAQSLLDGVVGADESEAHKVSDTLDETLQKVRQVQDGTAPMGLETGFYDLDKKTNGFQPGQMIIVAARPGVGKSTLAVDIMRKLSFKDNIPTLMFSLEMSSNEVNQRILSSEAEVDLVRMRKGQLEDGEWKKLYATRERLEGLPLFIDDNPDNTIMDVVAKTKMKVKRDHIGLMVVDYLQLLSGGKAESRQQEVSQISRQLKLLAKSCGIPIIAVAQLNRGSEMRESGVPKASDLRESGSLEQDADIILLLHREGMRDPDSARAGEVDVHVAKNRAGQTGVVTLADQLRYGRFVNLGPIGQFG